MKKSENVLTAINDNEAKLKKIHSGLRSHLVRVWNVGIGAGLPDGLF
jgi:hypothetical protein